ncbi:MAG: tetratricopeptide repeat protein [Rhodospirillaceae bacterium]|nr:tetratricopeptide repeat protein [Rhodospirillaceae bacterium]
MTALADIAANIAACLRDKRFAEAEALCLTLSATPGESAATQAERLHIQGFVDFHLGRTDAAISKISKAIACNRKNLRFYLSLADIHSHTDDSAAAEAALQNGLKQFPNAGALQQRLAEIWLARNKTTEAITLLQRSIKTAPTAQAYVSLGKALCDTARASEAIDVLQKGLNQFPSTIALMIELADANVLLDKLDESVALYQRAFQLNPSWPGLCAKIGTLFMSIFDYAGAAQTFRTGLQINPHDVACHVNLGLALFCLGKNKEAEQSLMFAAQIAPGQPGTLNGLGVLAETRGDTKAALGYYQQALDADPSFNRARFNRALLYLRQGDIEAGSAEYEHRWGANTSRLQTKVRPFTQPRWQGQDLKGGKLLVWGEQGLGDEVRTAAMIPDLLARNLSVVLECNERLMPLFQRSFPAAKVIATKTPVLADTRDPAIKAQIAADSLLQIVRPSLSAFPKAIAYLRADPDKVASLKSQLDTTKTKLRVGISWMSKSAQFGAGKSTALLDWTPILKTKGVQFVDLQYGDTTPDREQVRRTLGVDVTHITDLDLKEDIDGLAALISACDLVITVSNTTAHLAGALGVPTWVMTASGFFQVWAWFAQRRDSPWYPAVTLYRQHKHGDWDPLIREIASDLKSTDLQSLRPAS